MATVYVQRCALRTDGPIYYATREIGSLIETGDYLHNYALTYALGFAKSSYHVDTSVPSYREQLEEVTVRGIYVTPCTPRHVTHMISSLKFGKETWHEDTAAKTPGNYPRYLRIKEIAPESEFVFHVLSNTIDPVPIPRWVRLGIWMTLCHVTVEAQGICTLQQNDSGQAIPQQWALNPLDLSSGAEANNFDIIPMPPNSLITNAHILGSILIGTLTDVTGKPDREQTRFPATMSYLANMPLIPDKTYPT